MGDIDPPLYRMFLLKSHEDVRLMLYVVIGSDGITIYTLVNVHYFKLPTVCC